MLRNVSTCPYCGQVSAAVDDEGPDLVLAPDLAGGVPCGHLAFVVASLEAYDSRDGARVPERTGHWLWVRGAGTRSLPHGPVDPLSACVDEVACGFPLGGPAPGVPYAVGGATAGVRDAVRPGSGEFPLGPLWGGPVSGFLDALALYSLRPDELVAEVRRLAAGVARG
ncbi:unnamed protein product [Gemmataceae bacterium]|nr:unnamed protein product [Gemmataceae bacterium]VTU00919.1 unnamed protein product [Gemmataceae bacterium]